jgi:hypothetical protein
MAHVFEGRLRGRFCDDDCIESISDVIILLYRAEPRSPAAGPEQEQEQEPRELAPQEIEGKASRKVGEGKTDSDGRFRITLDDRYQDGALEVDVRCTTVPGLRADRDRRERRAVQFTAAVVSPDWTRGEQGLVARWDYIIAAIFWCWIRRLFDAWVICGRVVTCRDRRPVPDAIVRARDADWLQDDTLGEVTTDTNGHFRIDYTSVQFRKTPFSPWINTEHTEGPDLYFEVEYAGAVELDENQPDGRRRGRENVGACFCVELCIDADVPVAGEEPFFTRVGKFNIEHDFHPSGLANKAKGLSGDVGGDGWGFYSQIILCGFCPAHHPVNGQEMYYRFLYVHPDAPGAEVPITGPAMVGDLQIEDRLVPWGADPAAHQAAYVAGAGATPDVPAPTPDLEPPVHVIVPDAAGWVKVDQRGAGVGPDKLLMVNTWAIVPGGAAGSPGDQPGVDPAVPRNGTRIRIIFETTTDPANPAATERQALEAGVLINNWDEAAALFADQLHGAGVTPCSSLLTNLDIRYTLDHQLVGDWSIGVSGAAFNAPFNFPNPSPLAQGPTAADPRGDADTINLSLVGWPACSYTVSMGSRRNLTTGEGNDLGRTMATFTFCIRDA